MEILSYIGQAVLKILAVAALSLAGLAIAMVAVSWVVLAGRYIVWLIQVIGKLLGGLFE